MIGAVGGYVLTAHGRVGRPVGPPGPGGPAAAAAGRRRGPERARRPDGPGHLRHHPAARGDHLSLVGGVTGALTLVATVVLMGIMDLVLLGVTVWRWSLVGAIVGLVVPQINQATQAGPGVGRRDGHGAGAHVRRGPHGQGVRRRAARERAGATRRRRSRGGQSVRAAKWSSFAGNMAGVAAQVAFLAVLSVGGARVASGAIDVRHPGRVPALRLLPDGADRAAGPARSPSTRSGRPRSPGSRRRSGCRSSLRRRTAPAAPRGRATPASVSLRGVRVPLPAATARRPHRSELRRAGRRA